MAYQKHVWATGIPNRKKFEEMDEAIEKVAPANDGTNGQVLTKTSNGPKWQTSQGGLPETGNLHEILKVGSSGPMWGKADSDYVNYVQSETHAAGSVGAELASLSEKIENIDTSTDVDVTEVKIVGKYIYYDSNETKVYKPIYQKSYHLTSDWESYQHGITNMEQMLDCRLMAKGNDGCFYNNGWAAESDSRDFMRVGPTVFLLVAVNNNVLPRGIEFVDVTLRYTLSTDTPIPV